LVRVADVEDDNDLGGNTGMASSDRVVPLAVKVENGDELSTSLEEYVRSTWAASYHPYCAGLDRIDIVSGVVDRRIVVVVVVGEAAA
jgi:hypothetical protein